LSCVRCSSECITTQRPFSGYLTADNHCRPLWSSHAVPSNCAHGFTAFNHHHQHRLTTHQSASNQRPPPAVVSAPPCIGAPVHSGAVNARSVCAPAYHAGSFSDGADWSAVAGQSPFPVLHALPTSLKLEDKLLA